MRLTDMLIALAVGIVLFTLYVLEWLRCGSKNNERLARVPVPAPSPGLQQSEDTVRRRLR